MKHKIAVGLLQPNVYSFVQLYRLKKKYPQSSYICLCEIDEILEATPAHFRDTSFSGGLHFDNIVEFKEMKMGWDGDNRITIAVYYLTQYVTARLRRP